MAVRAAQAAGNSCPVSWLHTSAHIADHKLRAVHSRLLNVSGWQPSLRTPSSLQTMLYGGFASGQVTLCVLNTTKNDGLAIVLALIELAGFGAYKSTDVHYQ